MIFLFGNVLFLQHFLPAADRTQTNKRHAKWGREVTEAQKRWLGDKALWGSATTGGTNIRRRRQNALTNDQQLGEKKKLEREGESDATINTVSERNTNREIKKN